MCVRETETERQIQTDRQTDREKYRDRERERETETVRERVHKQKQQNKTLGRRLAIIGACASGQNIPSPVDTLTKLTRTFVVSDLF